MSHVRQRSPRQSVDEDSMASPAPIDGGASPLLPLEKRDITLQMPPPTKEGRFSLLKGVLLAGVVVQNAAMNVTARWSRVEALEREEQGICHASPGAVVLVIESMKIVLSLLFLAVELRANPITSVVRTTMKNPVECLKIVVPAVLYVIQNQLMLVAAANLEAPVLGLFGQLKILTTALCSVVLLGRQLGKKRWVALYVLTAGIATVQASQMHSGSESGDKGAKNVPLGLLVTFVVASLSGFSGVFFEKVLKGSPISLWTRNVHLALFSVFTTGSQVYSSANGAGCPTAILDYVFEGLGPVAWAYVLIQAGGGLLIAAVIKYADNILKASVTQRTLKRLQLG